ncbi:MAG: DNA-processing protein DprA [Patescibacteria group bacterium]|nr:DNA-processing protein DprA [Patescibacteria group bacterium]
MEEEKFLNALWRCKGMTNKRLRKIRNYFVDFEAAWKASASELIEAGIKDEAALEIVESRQNIDPSKEWDRLNKLGIRLITKQDACYPKLLNQILSAPEILYIKGEIKSEDELALTVVGSRNMTKYGKQAIEKIVGPLVTTGMTIISGLALGTDSAAHKMALNVNGRTIAVLANGLERIYPSTNERLAKEILDNNGAIISEYPLDAEPFRQRFPARNRIVAGLGQGTLIIEAAEESGSLITARMTADYGRPVFAIPGSIFSNYSKGTNNLIKNNLAKAVTTAEDILSVLKVNTKNVQASFSQPILEHPLEIKIYDLLSDNPVTIDELFEKTKFKSSEIASALTLMEMRGQVKSIGGGMWIKA